MLAVNFNECNKWLKTRQCLEPIYKKGFCKFCWDNAKGVSTLLLLQENIRSNNRYMVKKCLNELALSQYDIIISLYSISSAPPNIADLIYFHDGYEQRPFINHKPALIRLSPNTILFICERIFLINCLLNTFQDRGILDLKYKLMSTKINQDHLDYIYHH